MDGQSIALLDGNGNGRMDDVGIGLVGGKSEVVFVLTIVSRSTTLTKQALFITHSWHTPLNSTVHHVDNPDMTSLRLLPLARPRTGVSPTVSSSLHLIAVLLFLALRLLIFPMPLIFLFLL